MTAHFPHPLTQADIAQQVQTVEDKLHALIVKYDLQPVNYPPFLTGTPMDLARALYGMGVRP